MGLTIVGLGGIRCGVLHFPIMVHLLLPPFVGYSSMLGCRRSDRILRGKDRRRCRLRISTLVRVAYFDCIHQLRDEIRVFGIFPAHGCLR
ncbi:hypothetical protein Tco_0424920 [Tanacetum coccineum]